MEPTGASSTLSALTVTLAAPAVADAMAWRTVFGIRSIRVRLSATGVFRGAESVKSTMRKMYTQASGGIARRGISAPFRLKNQKKAEEGSFTVDYGITDEHVELPK